MAHASGNKQPTPDPASAKAPIEKPAGGLKRSFDETPIDIGGPHNDDVAAESSDNELEGSFIDKNCDQVRRQINTFIEAGGMKVGEFQGAIGVSSNAYSRFMGQHGPMKGSECDTYHEAWSFFKKRELKGVPMPAKERKTASKDTAKDAANGAPKNGKATKKKTENHPDISDIRIHGEDRDAVQVFDTCAEIRKKISAYLRKPYVTDAGFCKELHAQYHTDFKPKNITSFELSSFRGKKGPIDGNRSSVYYAAYVFFEKIRVAEKKPQSKHQQEMMKEWPQGVDTVHDCSRVFCFGSERPVMDKYGKMKF